MEDNDSAATLWGTWDFVGSESGFNDVITAVEAMTMVKRRTILAQGRHNRPTIHARRLCVWLLHHRLKWSKSCIGEWFRRGNAAVSFDLAAMRDAIRIDPRVAKQIDWLCETIPEVAFTKDEIGSRQIPKDERIRAQMNLGFSYKQAVERVYGHILLPNAAPAKGRRSEVNFGHGGSVSADTLSVFDPGPGRSALACADCMERNPRIKQATGEWHEGVCDVCQREVMVTDANGVQA